MKIFVNVNKSPFLTTTQVKVMDNQKDYKLVFTMEASQNRA